MNSNYNDALAQMRAAGLLVDVIEFGQLRRRHVEGSREKRGWYHLHQINLPNGDELIVGSYGIWHGNDNNAQKIEIKKDSINAELNESVRKRMAEDLRQAEAVRKADAARAADRAGVAWRQCSEVGDSEYLHRKGVLGHGVRYSPSGALAVPMLDVAGKVHGLQIIRPRAPAAPPGSPARKLLDKEFWPQGLSIKGHFHLLGMALGAPIVLVCEGYATAATLFEATALPVAVAFSANNLAPVAKALQQRYKQARILICADDDSFSLGNPGITSASAAAIEVAGAWVAPIFADLATRQAKFEAKGVKITDFNDLHALEGLHVVRTQLEARITALGWRQMAKTAQTPAGGGDPAKEQLRPIETADELLERFSLVYGQGGSVFDHQEHCLVTLSDMRDLCRERYTHREWTQSPLRKIARVASVGFDPAESDPDITCNLWGGWPTTPRAGNCQTLLDLLRYMCANDDQPEHLYRWVLNWLAYPIQHPGAKMQTALVVHGPQGTGKNMFFESIMNIYGRYGRVIDQSSLEDKFNDCFSRKLFLIADEVVTRQDLYQLKNKLKSLITGEWIRINPKNMAAYDERNHVNLVFLSNEMVPTIVEQDDRRHAVIKTPEKLSPEFYAALKAEIDAGGTAALHDYLLHLDLGNFGPSSKPPDTQAKKNLVEQGLDSPMRFLLDFEAGEVRGFPAKGQPALLTPCLSSDFYLLYVAWCRRHGLKDLHSPRFLGAIADKRAVKTERKRLGMSGAQCTVMHLPGGQTKPDTEREADWLHERCRIFRSALSDYRAELAEPI